MDVEVNWESNNTTCDTDESSHVSEQVGCKVIDIDYSQPSSPVCDPAGSSGKQELPVELQCEDEETYETYYKKREEITAGVFVTSSTNFDLQCDNEDLELYSSEEPQRSLSVEDENIILIDAFNEPISGEALPYRRRKCGASFQDLEELQEHKQIHLTEHSYWCPICGKEFFHAANLRMHKLIHSSDRPHRCPECDKGFICMADVWKHLRNVHKIERSKVVLGNGMVRNLASTVHKNQPGNGEIDQRCSENQETREEEWKPYICQLCGKGFRKPNLLSRHKVIHRQDKPHKCQECGKSFVERLKLKRHQQIHSGERPFYCDECGRTFTQLVTLQCHQRIHTGEKPYSCARCGRCFTVSATLRKHERTHKVDKS
uniref:C2H2-type domain-containing protein n=1 Tax=Pelusios castaneus TaxID=367368 RepID=A0A8C8VF86_9SAUR